MTRELNSFSQIPLFLWLGHSLNLPWGVENRLSRIITLGWTPCSMRTFTASITVLPVPYKWVGGRGVEREGRKQRWIIQLSFQMCVSESSFLSVWLQLELVSNCGPIYSQFFLRNFYKVFGWIVWNLERNSQLLSISWRFKNLWDST